MRLVVLALLAAGALFGAPARPVCNVRDYGAPADGAGRSTAAIRKAVEACAAAGGGTVYFPPGTYVTGAIELKSNITLDVEAGATIKFHNDRSEYPIVPGRLEGVECLTPAPLIGGRNLQNITITGRGTLTADNAAWRKEQADHEDGHAMWTGIEERLERKEKIPEADYRKAATWLRPSFIRPMDGKNILIEGIHIVGSPMWTLHILYCDNVVIRNVTVETYPGANTDGVDIDSSSNVRISDSYFDTGDDDICIKSGRDVDGRRVNRPSEDIAITNCITHRGHGAVVVGSETAGGVRNVSATNIVCRGTDHGVRVKSGRGRGGTVENLRFQGWTMEDITRFGILITNYYTKVPQEPVSERTPIFRDIAVSNMTILRAATAVSLEGLPEMPVNNVRISDIIANGKAGLSAHDFAGLQLNHVEVNAASGPAFLIKDVTDLEMNGVAERKPNAAPVIRLDNCPGAILRASKAWTGTGVFLSLGPEQRKRTILENNQVSAAKMAVEESDKDWWPKGGGRKKGSKKAR